MTETINKVVVLKATPINDAVSAKFTKSFNQTFKVTQQLFNEIVCWGLDSVYTKDLVTTDTEGNKTFNPKDLKVARKALYNSTDKSVTFEQFEKMLKVMYIALTNSSNSRGMVSPIIGNPQSEEKIGSADWETIETITNKWNKELVKESNIIYKISNTLKDIGFRNRSPYSIELSPGERYTVVSNIHRMLTSWIECDAERSKTYKEEEAEIEKAYSEIDAAIAKDIKGLFDSCVKNNIIKHFDPRVHAYLRDCIIPALKSGKNVTEHFFLNKDGDKIDFSLHDDFFKCLKDTPSLWNSEAPIILEKIHILEMIMSHNVHHPNAFYPFIGENDIHRFQYLFGDNYTGYEFETKGETVADVKISVPSFKETVEYNFTKGCKITDLFLAFTRSKEDKDAISFRIHTKDKYHSGDFNPNSYFNDLSVWNVDTGKCTNLFQFPRKGKIVQALVKEPAIVITNGYYAVRLNMTVVTKNDTSLNEDLKWYLATALPATKSDRSAIKDTPANIERLKKIKGNTFRFLGVDLGQRTPFSWAVGESTITGPVNDLNILKTGEYEVTNNDEYWNFLNDLKGFSKIIGIIKGTSKGKEGNFNHIFVKQTIEHAKAYLKDNFEGNADKQVTIKRFIGDTDHYKTLKNLLVGNDLATIKKNPNFIGTIILKYLTLRFGELKDARKYHLRENDISTKLNQEFKWLKIIENMKRVLRSTSYLGTDNNRTPINLDNLTDYFNGVKDNFLKVIASSIVDVAVENDCNAIVIEGLNPNATRSSLNKRNENFLHSLWSPARVQGAIENAANWYGIVIGEVSESQTSQVHHETQTYGYREGTKLYYMEKGKLKETHADMNAAKNIIRKFVTRHASTTQVSLNNISEKDDEGKRMKGFLTHKFGTIKAATEYFKKNFAGVDFVYLNDGKWISKEQKMNLQDSIKALVEPKATKVAKA
jgi:IS605 OrfB family transposase